MGFGWRAAGVILTTCLLLVGIEGLASYTLVARNVIETKSLSTRRYTKYDANLGWVSEPNVFLPDMYGPGIYLRTNAQQFRANHDTTTVVQEGKIRIVCSGDSFTEGYGVDNDHAWCERLSTLNPKLETVNMGQDGYGADQAYLWYKQGGAKIEHQIHLFAFITDDFYRMLNDTFWDYAKPRLEIENGVLVARNVPVPRRSYYFPWITQNVGNLKNLRTVQLLDRLLRKIKPTPKVAPQLSQKERDEKARQLLRTIFADLKRLNEQCSSKLVLVYLPTIWELNSAGAQGWRWTDPKNWTVFLEEQSRSLGVPLINFFSEFHSRPYDELARLFIPKGQLAYPEAEGHLNNAGNETVAQVIYDKLVKDTTISCALLARLAPPLRASAVGSGTAVDRRPACLQP